MNLRKSLTIGAIGLIAAGGTVVGVLGTSGASASGPPAPPNLTHPTQMGLLGSNGQPIIGKDGKPIMLTVGGAIPQPPAPGTPAFRAATANIPQFSAAQIAAAKAQGVGPETVTLPNETDQQKAQRLAPDQAQP